MFKYSMMTFISVAMLAKGYFGDDKIIAGECSFCIKSNVMANEQIERS